MKVSKKNLKAFSLVEISVVILTIGLLIAGITRGLDLYQDFKITTARSLTQNSPVGRISDLSIWLETVSLKSFDKNEAVENAEISKWYDINPTLTIRNFAYNNNQNAKPTYDGNGINNLPTIKFDGVNDALISNIYDTTPTNNITYFVVTKRLPVYNYNTSSFSLIERDALNDDKLMAFGEHTGNELRPRVDNVGAGYITPHPGNNNPYIASCIFTGTTNTIYLNGVKSNYANSRAFPITNNFNINRIVIGSRWSYVNEADNFTASYNGNIGEIIFFSRALSESEHSLIINYLRKKWGI